VYGDRKTAWGDPGMPTEVIVPVFWHKTPSIRGKANGLMYLVEVTIKLKKKKTTNIFTKRNSVL
jgi:hypothetical protein